MKLTPYDNGPVLNPCTLEGRNFQIDPYIGCQHLCYYCYALNQARTDWSHEIRYHADLESRLNKELSGLAPQTIYMGWQTDPYQPCEAELRQTRRILEVLLAAGHSASILTKSDLVIDDLDLLREMHNPTVSFSVAFDDDSVRPFFEANTMTLKKRIEALSRLHDAGIRTSALVCPVIPYITDVRILIDLLTPHVDTIWFYGLSIQDRAHRNWRNMQSILLCHYSDIGDKIEAAIFSKEHPFWDQTRQMLHAMAAETNLQMHIRL